MPTTGSANYTGIVQGYSNVPASTGPQRPYAIDGTASLAYNFGTAAFSGAMHPFATDRDSGTRYDLGSYGFTGASTPGSTTFTTNFDRGFTIVGVGTTSGGILGRFTGPNAQEFIADWRTGMLDPITGTPILMGGIIVGKQP